MISVVIPLFNKEKSIHNTINSVLTQTFKAFELLIVNDGSTDKSLEIISQIKDERIRILNQKNSGVSSARNLGVDYAKYNYVALLDGDDIWLPDFLDEMYRLILEFPEASLFGCAYSIQCNENEISTFDYGFAPLSKGIIDYFTYAKENTLFTSSSVVFRKTDFKSIGGFDTNLAKGEDIDLWIRFGLFKKVVYYNNSLVIYKLDAENRVSNVKLQKSASLIHNLERYKKYTDSDPEFKKFLDEWRLAHISKFFKCESTEVTEISSLLNEIDLRNRSPLWKLLKITPGFSHKTIYKTWFKLKEIYNSKKSDES